MLYTHIALSVFIQHDSLNLVISKSCDILNIRNLIGSIFSRPMFYRAFKIELFTFSLFIKTTLKIIKITSKVHR